MAKLNASARKVRVTNLIDLREVSEVHVRDLHVDLNAVLRRIAILSITNVHSEVGST